MMNSCVIIGPIEYSICACEPRYAGEESKGLLTTGTASPVPDSHDYGSGEIYILTFEMFRTGRGGRDFYQYREKGTKEGLFVLSPSQKRLNDLHLLSHPFKVI